MFGDLSLYIPLAIVTLSAITLTLYTAWKRTGEGSYLCEDCKFNTAEDCLKVERPKALICTSYRSVSNQNE